MCIICQTTMIFCNGIGKELFICLNKSWSKFFDYYFIFSWICVKVVQVEVIEYS